MPETSAEVDTDTVKFIPHKIAVPEISDKEAISQAVADIVHILKKPTPNNTPMDMKGDPIIQAFSNLAEILGRKKTTSALAPQLTEKLIFLPPLQVPFLSTPQQKVTSPQKLLQRPPSTKRVATAPRMQARPITPLPDINWNSIASPDIVQLPRVLVPCQPTQRCTLLPNINWNNTAHPDIMQLSRVPVLCQQSQSCTLSPNMPLMHGFPTPKSQSVQLPYDPRAVTPSLTPELPKAMHTPLHQPLSPPCLIIRGMIPKIHAPAPNDFSSTHPLLHTISLMNMAASSQ
eukprot:2623165-Ditylum_brightwellii.AAC.2